MVSEAKAAGIWFHQRLESPREQRVQLWSPLPGKWDVASGVGWGCPAQAGLWGVAALSSAAHFSHFPRAESLCLATLPP